MINCKHINPYNSKLKANKVKYSTASVPYKTTHDLKVSFSMLNFYSRKIKTYSFHVDNAGLDAGIFYDMNIGRYLMVQLGLKAKFGSQILEGG